MPIRVIYLSKSGWWTHIFYSTAKLRPFAVTVARQNESFWSIAGYSGVNSDLFRNFADMSTESRLIDKSAHNAEKGSEQITGLQTISVSQTGFCRILVGKHHGRKIVVKALKPECASNPIALNQLKKEFDTTFPLDSPNVARVFRFTQIDDGIPAIEMEWCDGLDVRSLLSEGLSAAQASEIVSGVLGGLIHIHSAGIVHRDIKPENVVYDPLRKLVKIIDFGSVYSTGALFLQGPSGTPRYTPDDKKVAPTRPEPADDLYALGVMCRELAEAINIGSRHDQWVKKHLLLFSDKLIHRQFDNATAALDYYVALSRPKSRRTLLLLGIVTIICISLAIAILLPHPETLPVVSPPNTPESDTTASPPTPLPPIEEAEEPPAVAGATSVTLPKKTESDSETFNLGIYAGPLLRAAAQPDASPDILRDAFVINFGDSLYHRGSIISDVPASMTDAEMRVLAKKYAQRYLAEMERNYAAQFGRTGDSHRRAVLLEGRFYCAFLSYHSRPVNAPTDTINNI